MRSHDEDSSLWCYGGTPVDVHGLLVALVYLVLSRKVLLPCCDFALPLFHMPIPAAPCKLPERSTSDKESRAEWGGGLKAVLLPPPPPLLALPEGLARGEGRQVPTGTDTNHDPCQQLYINGQPMVWRIDISQLFTVC